MHLVMSDNMRETGWSPIYCRRRILRGFDFSKILLLQKVISDDKVANNGEILYFLNPLIITVE